MECGPKCSVEGKKEVRLGDVVNVVAHKLLDFLAVRPFQYTKTPNV
jgi:hypothetical protein